jgi:hypothetical protein
LTCATPAFGRIGDDRTQLADAGTDSAERDEVCARRTSDHVCEGRFSAPRRTPQDERGHRIAFDRAAQRRIRTEHVFLTDDLVERLRTQPCSQRRSRCVSGGE